MKTHATLTADGHPTKAAVQGVIDRLGRQAPRKGTVDMALPYIFKERGGACATVACHAGLYAAACLTDPDWTRANGVRPAFWDGAEWVGAGRYYEDGRWMLFRDDSSGHVPVVYRAGERLMAEHLGFRDTTALMQWARTHPEIWGNGLGAGLFGASAAAFAPTDAEAQEWANGAAPSVLTLADVIAKWEAVRDRLPA